MARLRLCKVNVRLGTPASASSFLASSRDFLMSFEKPGSLTSSDSGVANGEPGRIRPPTARSVEMRDRPWLPPQRSIAMQSARRIRTSSNGFFSTLKQTRRLSVQLDSLDPNFVSHRLHQPVATVARRDGASRLRDRTNHSCSIANYTNSDRRNQTTDRYRRAAAFQSGEHHSSAGREEQRLGGQRHPLPDVRIDRGRARWRGQNAQRRRGAVHRRRKDRGANGG